MPVTLTTANHEANPWKSPKVSHPDDLLANACPREYRRSKKIIQSSFSKADFAEQHISATDHGFVRAIRNAYSYHHHLTLRPEDIWFSILTQLNFFINAHGEELRSFFVPHEGQKELEVIDGGTIDTADFGALAVRMTSMIEKNVLDPELRTWIMPEFTTTTDTDRVVAAILMMGSLQTYFTYKVSLLCGIPTVTLLGERKDWAQILKKLDKIPELGDEPAKFTDLLRPVLQRFVSSFDSPNSPQILDFWSKCVHQSGGSGPHYLSGWITAFCFWDPDGRSLYGDEPHRSTNRRFFKNHDVGFELDGMLFHRVDTDDIPAGYASVPVTVDDNGNVLETRMLAGLVGIQATRGKLTIYKIPDKDVKQLAGCAADSVLASPGEDTTLDSLQPLSGWWMYETEAPEVAEAREKEIKAIKDEMAALKQSAKDSFPQTDHHFSLYDRLGALESF